jgi:hypothetical protein
MSEDVNRTHENDIEDRILPIIKEELKNYIIIQRRKKRKSRKLETNYSCKY